MNQMQHVMKVLLDLRLVILLAQGLQLFDQLRNVLLMKNRDCLVTDKTQIRKVRNSEIRKETLHE